MNCDKCGIIPVAQGNSTCSFCKFEVLAISQRNKEESEEKTEKETRIASAITTGIVAGLGVISGTALLPALGAGAIFGGIVYVANKLHPSDNDDNLHGDPGSFNNPFGSRD